MVAAAVAAATSAAAARELMAAEADLHLRVQHLRQMWCIVRQHAQVRDLLFSPCFDLL
jgi:hypothetical protein